MREIEVKARVNNLKELEDKLKDLGCVFSETLNDQNKIFINTDREFTDFQNDTNFVRIRNRNNKFFLTLKRPQSNELDCIEKEVEVSDAKQMQEILELCDYHLAVEYSSKRKKTKYKDMKICLDEVKDLGTFVEVEKMSDDNAEAVQKELFAFLKTLGIKEADRVTQGYDTLTYLKNKK